MSPSEYGTAQKRLCVGSSPGISVSFVQTHDGGSLPRKYCTPGLCLVFHFPVGIEVVEFYLITDNNIIYPHTKRNVVYIYP